MKNLFLTLALLMTNASIFAADAAPVDSHGPEIRPGGTTGPSGDVGPYFVQRGTPPYLVITGQPRF